MIKILMVDDHEIVREGLKKILKKIPGAMVKGEAGSGNEALEKVRNDDYDFVILDISMPDMSGLDILKNLKREKPRLPVLVLSMHPEEQYALRVFKLGGDGYINKRSVAKELIAAINRIVSGGKYITGTIAEQLAISFEKDAEKEPHERLSDREFQVMSLIAQGIKTKEIAKELHLSENTIKTYRHRIFEKMMMKSDLELIRYALENQLI